MIEAEINNTPPRINSKPARQGGNRCYTREEWAAIQREWYRNNKEKVKERAKRYRKDNPQAVRATAKAYLSMRRIKDAAWRKDPRNAEKLRQRQREAYRNNPAPKSEYRKNNRARINLVLKIRRQMFPALRIERTLRSRMNKVLQNNSKGASARILLGCTPEQCRAHIELLFKPGMTWENWGVAGWHIDHIQPCASFDLADTNQQRRCFHYTNLQPLWAIDNLRKGAKLLDQIAV